MAERKGKAAEEWLTWVHQRWGKMTKLATEDKPRWANLADPRKATPTEIRDEKARRKRHAEQDAKEKAFKARPEFKCADDIRSTIEWMTPDKHPLDALTPDEWRELRDKICGAKVDL